MIPRAHPLAAVARGLQRGVRGGGVGGTADVLRRGRRRRAHRQRGARRHRRGGPQPARRHCAGRTRRPTPGLPVLPMGETLTRYYVSLDVADRPGVLAPVAEAFARHDVSIQRDPPGGPRRRRQLVIVTHTAPGRGAGRHGRRTWARWTSVRAVDSVMRVEGEDGRMSPPRHRQSGTGHGRRSARPPAPWRGVIEEYRDRLPVPTAPRWSPCARAAPRCCPRPALSARTGCDVYLKVEGLNPTGSFKDRGMTVAISLAVRPRRQAVICASTGNTSASAAAYAARAGLACAVLVPRGQDRPRQAGPGAGARGQAAAGRRQLRRLPGAGPQAVGRATRWRWSTRSTRTGCRARRRPRSRSSTRSATRPDVHCLPVGNAGNITAYWMGYQRVLRRRAGHAGAADVRLPGQRRGADRDGEPVRQPGDHRDRDPDRQPGLVAAGRGRPGRVRRR